MIQNTLVMGIEKKIIDYFAEIFFSVSEGALLITLKFFFGKMKNACGFFGALQFKLPFCIIWVKILLWLKNKFFINVKKIIKHFA